MLGAGVGWSWGRCERAGIDQGRGDGRIVKELEG